MSSLERYFVMLLRSEDSFVAILYLCVQANDGILRERFFYSLRLCNISYSGIDIQIFIGIDKNIDKRSFRVFYLYNTSTLYQFTINT